MAVIKGTPWQGAPWKERPWQAACLGRVLAHLGSQHPQPGLVRAVMGAGKSILIAEVCASFILEATESIVVTTPKSDLVDQLSKTLALRLGKARVGRFYTHAKEWAAPVVVCCNDSMATLSRTLHEAGRRCVLWIADEAHRTECESVLNSHIDLDPQFALGVTATPYRSSTKQSLSLYAVELFSYGVSEALRDGVIVPWKLVPWAGDVIEVDDACLEMCQAGAKIGPGIVNARSVEDAEAFARRLSEAGVRSRAVHYRTSKARKEAIIRAVSEGRLDCIVHVNMLSEGSDIPCLRWICLRRNCRSRVRFAQEVGRVLRGHPGKEYAVIYDPRDLFGTLKLSYEAVVGQVIDPDPEPTPEQQADTEARKVDEASKDRVRLLEATSRYLRTLTVAFEAKGLIKRYVAAHQWRDMPATDAQLHRAKRNLSRCVLFVGTIPDAHRCALRHISQSLLAGRLSRGQVADLNSVLQGLVRAKGWPSLSDLPELDSDAA